MKSVVINVLVIIATGIAIVIIITSVMVIIVNIIRSNCIANVVIIVSVVIDVVTVILIKIRRIFQQTRRKTLFHKKFFKFRVDFFSPTENLGQA